MGKIGEAAYQLNPLTRANIAISQTPEDGSLFFSPAIIFSLFDNLELALIRQVFYGSRGELYGSADHIGAARLKWSV